MLTGATTPLRIGVWFDARHVAYGGPAQVLIGTMLGFLQDAEATSRPCVLLLNEPGDVNWMCDVPECAEDWDAATRGRKRVVGPLVFNAGMAHIKDPDAESLVWRLGDHELTVFVAPSAWWAAWICRGLPFHDVARWNKPMIVWGAGVDVEKFQPKASLAGPRHDFFIYFKSQAWHELRDVHVYLMKNYFRLHGPTLIYYFHTHEELLAAATSADFCIFMSGPETQGLAALEIMACGCPLFVIDACRFEHGGVTMQGATSVTCWEEGVCGVKSGMPNIATDFPRFLEGLGTYKPREFVEERYSWRGAAGTLRRMMELL